MQFKKITIATAVGISVIALSGCASNSPRLTELENELRVKEKENQELRDNLAKSSEQKASAPATATPVAAPLGDLLPPNAKSGECYARVWVPAAYRDLTKDVLVREESERVEIIPAEYSWAEETLLVKEASSRLETVPAVYGTETETIMVKEASRNWNVSLAKGAAPASHELLKAATDHGIDMDAATPGMCFHEHYIPARFETDEQQVLVSEASSKVAVSEAKYRMVEKRVMVKEASFRMQEVPAVYKWEEEQVVDKPAHTIWKKGAGPIQRIDESTGEIMCLVEVPETYKTIRRKVLATPAATRRIEIPAEYKIVKVRELVEDAIESSTEIPAKYKNVAVTKKVADAHFDWHEVHNLEHPASTRTGLKVCLVEKPAEYKNVTRRVVTAAATTRKVDIPAEYETVKVKKLLSEAKEKRITIPAEYKTITQQELASEGHMEWRSILCETNMTGARITEIQSALKAAGYESGKIDGVVGSETMAAVNAFQRDKGLPVDRYLNVATLKALGVSAR
ncbi:MAG: peptidoglycan-binding domain-containing protein [Candidatus Sedimenticola sp. (ex Thyasira tokunagai)]